MIYEDRIILYIDILGFRKIVRKTCENNIEMHEHANALLNKLQKVNDFISKVPINSSIFCTQFSDTIIISFSDVDKQIILDLFSEMHRIIIQMVRSGVLFRGAMTYGKIHHKKDFCFGPALIEAYETESKAALYPRIIFDKSILNYLSGIFSNVTQMQYLMPGHDEKSLDFLRIDTDDNRYFDYFLSAAICLDRDELIDYFKFLRTLIIDGIENNEPDIRVKYGWMKNKYNNMKSEMENFIGTLDNFSPIKLPAASGVSSGIFQPLQAGGDLPSDSQSVSRRDQLKGTIGYFNSLFDLYFKI